MVNFVSNCLEILINKKCYLHNTNAQKGWNILKTVQRLKSTSIR